MSDLERLQGAWRIVSCECNGQAVPPEQYAHVAIEIQGNVGEEIQGGQSMSVSFQLDHESVPKSIDSTYLDGPSPGSASLGIYEFDTDRFRMCRTSGSGGLRPTTFATAVGSGLTLVTWARP